MGHRLTIHNKRSTEDNFWFKSFQYDRNIIDNIVDPSGGNINKLLTAVPSPFARMHLFDTAFGLALKNINNPKESIFDKMVSDCFDLFELLFNYQLHQKSGANLSIKIWDFSTHSNNLIASERNGHKQLAEVLRKYFFSNDKLKQMNTVYLFLLNNEVFGGTSPFTGCFTKPDIKKFALKKSNGHPYFSQTVPIWKRDDEFLLSIYSLFSPGKNSQLIQSAENVFKYLEKAINFVDNNSLKADLQNLHNNLPTNREIKLSYLTDDTNSIIKICGAEIPTQNTVIPHQISSPLEIDCPHLPEYSNKIAPLVLRDGKDHLNQSKSDIKIPHNLGDIKKLQSRNLPDNNTQYPYLVVDDFLEDHLIRINYPINYTSFLVPKFEGVNKDEEPGFLLPIKKEYFDFFDLEDLKEHITILKKTDGGYSVELNIPVKSGEQVIFKKYYYTDPKGNDSGRLISANVFFAFYPLFKVKDSDEFNDYYKIMMVDDESEYQNVELKIFDDGNNEIKDNSNAARYYKKFTRNIKTPENYGGSYYYETNFPYKFLQVNLSSGRTQKKNINGIIMPIWKEISLGNRKYDIAIDFGTTNSHVVLLENRENENTIPKALTIDESDQQTILFNKYKNDVNLTLTERYENWNVQLETRLISRQLHEFIPSIINAGDNPVYKFPIRTAVSTSSDYNSNSSNLLGNINISFIFEKDVYRSDENIQTNLKWEITEGDNEKKIKEFIKELLYLSRNKVLLNQGNPKRSRVLWFKPLSMYEGHQVHFKNIWDDSLKSIFKPESQNEQTYCLTESCAPYFYYAAQNKAQGTRPVLSIDIGGGSTDVSFFLNNEPQFGISFNFAGNAIWNPGLERRHENTEGIFIKYGRDFLSENIKSIASTDKDKLDKILKIFNSQHGPGIQSENLFNLYFTWDHIMHFTAALKRDPNIKFLLLLHLSSIIYHCIELLRLKGFAKPEYICVSGRGSKYLSILDPSRDLNLINGYLTGFVNDIYGVNDKYSVKLERVEQEKEATSIGGLYLLADSKKTGKLKDTPYTEPYLGELDPKFKNITYKEIDDSLKNSVEENVNRFLDIFFSQDAKYNFGQKFIINLANPLDYYKNLLKENSGNYLELGLNKRIKNVQQTDLVNEPLFFYPIITMIYELSKMFYNDNNS